MKVRKLLLIIFAIVISIHVNTAKEITGTHMLGFAASFNDPTIYITEIQYTDSTYIDKSNSLFSRENYSYQLRSYLRSIGAITPTCIATSARDQKKIEREYLSMRKEYERSGRYTIKYITAANFGYQGMIPQTSGLEQEKATKRKAKEAKKAAKIAKKRTKRGQKLAERRVTETNQPVTAKDTKQQVHT